MIIEMRTYRTIAGKRSEFLEIFRRYSIPAHEKLGMPILGPFNSIEDPDAFFFMRLFPDEASREPMKGKFYGSDLWRNELEHRLMPLLKSYDCVLVEDPQEQIAMLAPVTLNR